MEKFNFYVRTAVLFLSIALFTAVQAQTYHIQEGFSTTSLPTGWSGDVYFNSTANYGLLTGANGAGFNANAKFLQLPSVNSAGTLTFWMKGTSATSQISLRVSKSVGGGAWTTVVEFPKPINSTWTEQTVDINDANTNIVIKFEAYDRTGNSIYLDDVQLTTYDAGTPIITVTPSSLSGFSYVENAGPSTEQSFVISGSDLEANITIIPPANYEISLGTGAGFTATNPITLTEDAGEVLATTVYVRLKGGLNAGIFNGEDITASSTNATDKTLTCNGNVIKDEPANHVTGFTAAAQSHSSILLEWADAQGATTPDGYLIKMSDVAFGSITAPVDGTPEANGTYTINVGYGMEEYTWTGLNGETDYFFAIYPYTNTGSDINYKTDGTVPQASDVTPIAPDLLVLFDFEDFVKQSAISNNAEWLLYPYTADNGIAANKDISEISLAGGAEFAGWLSAARPNSDKWANGSQTKYWQTSFNTIGYHNLELSSRQRSSNTGPRDFKVQYSLNGWQWYDVPGATMIQVANDAYPYTAGAISGIALPQACNNQEEVYLRWIMTSDIAVNNAAVLTGGTSTIDDIEVGGFPITGGTYNTVVIDGNNSGWQASEVFGNISPLSPDDAAKFAHFTWDNDYIYYAVSGDNAAFANMATFMFINTNPDDPNEGTTDVYAWGQNIVAPFAANAVFIWQNNPDYMEFIEWDGSAWNVVAGIATNYADLSGFGMPGLEIHFEVGTEYREIKIPRAIIGAAGAGAKIKIASFTEEQWDSYWRYFAWPAEGWSNAGRAAGQVFSHAYSYELKEYVYPNENQYLKRDRIFENDATLSASETYSNLYIRPDVHVEIANGNTITVNEDFRILSNAGGTGSFIDFGTLNVLGNTIVDKYFANNTSTGWYFSPPIQFAWSGTFQDFDALYQFNTNAANWETINTTTSPQNLTAMRGYVTRNVGGDMGIQFWGNLNTGIVENNGLQRTGFENGNFGWNLVGNPYPSPVDWDAPTGWDKGNLNDAIYVRKADGVVASYIGGVGANGGSRYLAPMQAFWVQVYGDVGTPTGSGHLHANNSVRVNASNDLLKVAQMSNVLKLTLNRDALNDEAIIRFVDGASESFDRMFDAAKMFSEDDNMPQIFTFDGQNNFVINALGELTENKSVPLAYTTNHAGEHAISASDISSFDSNVSIYLEDKENNTMTDLRSVSVYTFTTNAGTINNRFVVHFALATASVDELQNNVSIYSNDNNIFVANAGEKATVTVYNMLGQEVLNEQVNSGSLYKISTSLSAGQYIVKVATPHSNVTEKVFVN